MVCSVPSGARLRAPPWWARATTFSGEQTASGCVKPCGPAARDRDRVSSADPDGHAVDDGLARYELAAPASLGQAATVAPEAERLGALDSEGADRLLVVRCVPTHLELLLGGSGRGELE